MLGLAGAYAGVRILPMTWMPGLLGCALLTLLGALWSRRSTLFSHPSVLRWALGLLVLLAFCAASAQRYQEFERWERQVQRGERAWVSGTVGDIRPYAGGQISLDLLVDPVAGWNRWHLRVIADPADMVAALQASPPSPSGELRLHVRTYPFRPAGNPGEFDRRIWALGKGYVATGYLESDRAGQEGREEPLPDELCVHWPELQTLLGDAIGATHRLAWRWRCALLTKLPEPSGALAVAMVLGQRDGITSEWSERFSRAGIAHLLAVSGLHVGFLLLFLTPVALAATRLATWARMLLWFVPATVVLGFVTLAGSPASAMRAGLIAVVALLGKALGRRVSSWQMLGVAGITLLTLNPHFTFDLGFQLSFLATAGIIAVAAPVTRVVRRAVRSRSLLSRLATALAGSALVSLIAQAATLPLVATHFSYLSVSSIVTNLVAVPLGAIVVVCFLAGLVIGEVYPAGVGPFVSIGEWCATQLLRIAEVGSKLGAVEVAMFSSAMSLAWYVFIAGLLLLIRGASRAGGGRAIRAGRRMAMVGATLLVLATLPPMINSLTGVVEIWVLDVGQGDSILIRAPWDRHVLVDGGGVSGRRAASGYDIGAERVVPTLRRLGVRRIDVLVNTHPHADHVQGLGAVVEQREVGRVYASWATSSSLSYRRFVDAVERKGLQVERPLMGDRIQLTNDVSLRFLATGALDEWSVGTGVSPNLNNRSVAVEVTGRHGRFLLFGDSEEAAIQRILTQEPDLRASGFVVPHHGAPLPTMPTLVRAVRPDVAVISVGAGNAYGHPSGGVLNALNQRGVAIWRTDQLGAVRVRLHPRGVSVDGVRDHPEG